jgi:hypothetical protein
MPPSTVNPRGPTRWTIGPEACGSRSQRGIA